MKVAKQRKWRDFSIWERWKRPPLRRSRKVSEEMLYEAAKEIWGGDGDPPYMRISSKFKQQWDLLRP
jgi:hypothetical protein